MPKAKANGIEINYEIHGSGDPVLLIGGLGADMFLWFRQIPELSKHFQVIAFDTRGAGESSKPEEPYSIEMFAADTAGLLQALGVPRAHVVGASLGGLIALEFLLSCPEMVNRVVLTATAPKSPTPQLKDIIPMLLTMRRSGDPAKDIRKSFELFTTSQWYNTHADIVEQYVNWRVAHPQPPAAYKRQQAAVKSYNCEARVVQIKAPTLIIHGTKDRIVPVKNGQWLSEHIPGAKLALLEAGHACNIEQDAQFNQLVTEFLKGR